MAQWRHSGGLSEWPLSTCAVKRRRFPAGASPTRLPDCPDLSNPPADAAVKCLVTVVTTVGHDTTALPLRPRMDTPVTDACPHEDSSKDEGTYSFHSLLDPSRVADPNSLFGAARATAYLAFSKLADPRRTPPYAGTETCPFD